MKTNKIADDIFRHIAEKEIYPIAELLCLSNAVCDAAKAEQKETNEIFRNLGSALVGACQPPTREQCIEAIAYGCGLGLRDEHLGWNETGDAVSTSVLDYIDPQKSVNPPYLDQGGMGLALIGVTRERRSRWQLRNGYYRGSVAHEVYLCGRNETGTFFSHRVRSNISSVLSAVDWIWSGFANYIVRRQGDVAIISGVYGPRMPASLPDGHCVVRDALSGEQWVMHHTHPPMLAPMKTGERLIIGRRAARKIYRQTRD